MPSPSAAAASNDFEGDTTAHYEVRDWARPPSAFYQNPVPPMVNLAIVGNPGVGKSAILNALGGEFQSGYSEGTGLTTVISKKQVTLNNIRFQLYDIPGINDCPPAGGQDTIVKHLLMLQDALNEGDHFVIIFVIQPTIGRIKPGDYMVMKTVIDSLKEGPQIGLILNQAEPSAMPSYRSSRFSGLVWGPLEKIVESGNKKFLSRAPPLVLPDHGSRDFNEDEASDILRFVLSFDPMPVISRNMVDRL
ncbi:hypothetical protein KI688_001090 [Linnemannia hyalina]|uniref:G domain-containing protein n=1 Tax=Linnemannia hyalina TaxID=64524 RepID=A0A9P8BZ54_9FUNG|nr:hypothetical protein KI688_001090 [Linnemannia hyalina]